MKWGIFVELRKSTGYAAVTCKQKKHDNVKVEINHVDIFCSDELVRTENREGLS